MSGEKDSSLVEKALRTLFEEGATLAIPIEPGFGVAVGSVDDMLDVYAEFMSTGTITY